MKKRLLHVFVTVAVIAIAFISMRGPVQHAQGEVDPSDVNAPTDKAAYFSHGDIETIWKELESRQVNNRRVMNGEKFNINIRIVKPNSPPLTHELAADVWVCEAGSAVAVTGGKLLNSRVRDGHNLTGTAIEGGTEQALTPGDILYVPPGVPHTFKDMKGFRAYLISFNVK